MVAYRGSARLNGGVDRQWSVPVADVGGRQVVL